jgi:hypothetical protein
MINLQFNVNNPWGGEFQTIWSDHTPFIGHKNIELEIYKDSTIISFEFSITTRCDHAGARLQIGLFGYTFGISLYDVRHFDYRNNRWEN